MTNPTTARIAYWYDRRERSWVIQQFDENNWEFRADWIGNGKEAAMKVVRQLEEEFNLTAEKI